MVEIVTKKEALKVARELDYRMGVQTRSSRMEHMGKLVSRLTNPSEKEEIAAAVKQQLFKHHYYMEWQAFWETLQQAPAVQFQAVAPVSGQAPVSPSRLWAEKQQARFARAECVRQSRSKALVR